MSIGFDIIFKTACILHIFVVWKLKIHRITFWTSIDFLITALQNFGSLSDSVKKDILLYGDSSLNGNKNKFILEATLTYIKSTDRFSGSIFD